MAEFIEVPPEIIQDILSRVPAKHLLRLRCVCKAWKDMIDDQSFFVKSHIKKQQSFSSASTILLEGDGALVCLSLDTLISKRDPSQDAIPLNQIILSGVPRVSELLPTLSCNGLILIPHDSMTESWALWNPLLQHYHLLPPPPPQATDPKNSNKFLRLISCGFGYDEGSDDYKVVRVDLIYVEKVEGCYYYYSTRVYSLKSRSWRTIDDFPGGDCLGEHAAFLDGTLYWSSCAGVVALDLRGDGGAHRLVAPRPAYIGNKKQYSERVDAFNGWLIWSCVHVHGNDMCVEAWVMMEDYSWTNLFSVVTPDRGWHRIVGFVKSKGKVFFSFGISGDGDGDSLRCLDLENMTWRDISVSGLFCSSLSSSSSAITIPTFSFSFTQISPLSLVRLENHYKNKNTSTGLKRKTRPN